MRLKFNFSMMIGLMAVLLTSACRSNSDSHSEDDYLGVYKGMVSYESDESQIFNQTGEVTVNKTGLTYELQFSDEIPTLGNLEMQDLFYVLTNLDATDSTLVRITPQTLQVDFKLNDSVRWKAQAFKD